MKAEMGVKCLQTKGGPNHQKLEKPRADSPEILQGEQPCPHVDLGLSDSRTETISFCCFQPPVGDPCHSSHGNLSRVRCTGVAPVHTPLPRPAWACLLGTVTLRAWMALWLDATSLPQGHLPVKITSHCELFLQCYSALHHLHATHRSRQPKAVFSSHVTEHSTQHR